MIVVLQLALKMKKHLTPISYEILLQLATSLIIISFHIGFGKVKRGIAMVEWSVISAIATVVRTAHEIFRDTQSTDRVPPAELPALPPVPPATQPERYQVGLGQRPMVIR
jgi:hypothetical protein